MKIRVSYSKKIGQPNYGSLGAEVAFEQEYDVNDQPECEAYVAEMMILAEKMVERELVRRDAHNGAVAPQPIHTATPHPNGQKPKSFDESLVAAKAFVQRAVAATAVLDIQGAFKRTKALKWTEEQTDMLRDYCAGQIAMRIDETYRVFAETLKQMKLLRDEHLDGIVMPAFEKKKDG